MGVFLGGAKLGQFSTKLSTLPTSQGLIDQLGLNYQYVRRSEYSTMLARSRLHSLAVKSWELKGAQKQAFCRVLAVRACARTL
jgi:hypothetical protein